jgi:hypothetical protein
MLETFAIIYFPFYMFFYPIFADENAREIGFYRFFHLITIFSIFFLAMMEKGLTSKKNGKKNGMIAIKDFFV